MEFGARLSFMSGIHQLIGKHHTDEDYIRMGSRMCMDGEADLRHLRCQIYMPDLSIEFRSSESVVVSSSCLSPPDLPVLD